MYREGAAPGNFWFVGGKRGVTVLDAMLRFAEHDYIRDNARRLGADGKYSKLTD